MMQKEVYKSADWQRVWRLSNDRFVLEVPEDIGPRISWFSLKGQENIFARLPGYPAGCGGDSWCIHGGHRLWHSPEDMGRTYQPDNRPVQIQPTEDGLLVQQEKEPATGLQKSLQIQMTRTQVIVQHQLVNHNLWPIRFAAWAISVMAPGGVSFTPLRTGQAENMCIPDLGVNIWPHTSMADPRALWGEEFFLLRQDRQINKPFKVGLATSANWVASQKDKCLFVKHFDRTKGAVYPDRDSAIALYTCADFSEIETLSPLLEVPAGGLIRHTEYWHLLQLAKPLSEPSEQQLQAAPWLQELYHLVCNF